MKIKDELMDTALWWATTRNGKIVAVNSGYPPHELKSNQFGLTEQEFHLLKSIRCESNQDVIELASEIVTEIANKFMRHYAKSK